MVLPNATLLNQIKGLKDKLGAEYKNAAKNANNIGKILFK
jgi:hypothetical protein